MPISKYEPYLSIPTITEQFTERIYSESFQNMLKKYLVNFLGKKSFCFGY